MTSPPTQVEKSVDFVLSTDGRWSGPTASSTPPENPDRVPPTKVSGFPRDGRRSQHPPSRVLELLLAYQMQTSRTLTSVGGVLFLRILSDFS